MIQFNREQALDFWEGCRKSNYTGGFLRALFKIVPNKDDMEPAYSDYPACPAKGESIKQVWQAIATFRALADALELEFKENLQRK